ncbi:MAG: 50S ribosomal protein L6 [Candidatus Micrarchaeota archaeon]|nr:50S ribosomal protein L6 [Candidatus Micrarchaeota archaeon]
MASKDIIKETLAVPAGITAKVEGADVSVSGPKGKQAMKLALPGLSIKHSGSNITLEGAMREVNTARAHIRNMFNGSANGYSQKMKVLYAHFPIALEIKGKDLVIKNFIGEKQPRKAKIVGETKVEAKGADVTVSGPSREDVGQTIANIRRNTKIKGRDSRVFQDGIYPIES